MNALKSTDPDVLELIELETQRQRDSIRLIPSENYVSQAVLEASGSVLTNKYSEGYPKKRYYEGQKYIDQLEELARKDGSTFAITKRYLRSATVERIRGNDPQFTQEFLDRWFSPETRDRMRRLVEELRERSR